jgi:hypothetical protein
MFNRDLSGAIAHNIQQQPLVATCFVGHIVGHISPQRRKDLESFDAKSLIHMVRLAGIEPTTPWFVAKYSIQLSYSRLEMYCSTRFLRILKKSQTFHNSDKASLLSLEKTPAANNAAGFPYQTKWWAVTDLNRGPKDYESDLTLLKINPLA